MILEQLGSSPPPHLLHNRVVLVRQQNLSLARDVLLKSPFVHIFLEVCHREFKFKNENHVKLTENAARRELE